MYDYQRIIDKYYPADTVLRDIYMRHCRSVAEKALKIAREKQLEIDPAEIEAGAMLHDIGIFLTDAAGIHCHGSLPYLAHGRAGADLLRAEGAPEIYARIAERHTGAGLTPDDIDRLGPALTPDRSYMPQTDLEQLICYADKFFSKNGDMLEKPLAKVRASISKFGDRALSRFDALHSRFATEGQ